MANRLSSIVTRTGDDGTTGLTDGARVPKDSARIHAMGEVDELNSQIGVLRAEVAGQAADAWLERIQHDLFDLGGELSWPGHALVGEEHVAGLDALLAKVNATLPRLEEFILPAGIRSAAQAHVCRCVCRRAERAVVGLSHTEAVGEHSRLYLNRLSDFLFVLARTLQREGGGAEPQWKPRSR